MHSNALHGDENLEMRNVCLPESAFLEVAQTPACLN